MFNIDRMTEQDTIFIIHCRIVQKFRTIIGEALKDIRKALCII